MTVEIMQKPATNDAAADKEELNAKRAAEALERHKKHIASVTETIAKFDTTDPLYFKTAKIKESIYNHMLNEVNERAKAEIKSKREVVNKEALEKARAANKANPEAKEKVVPQYRYSFKYSDATKKAIGAALDKLKQDNKEKYIKEMTKDWTKETKESFAEFKKKALLDTPDLSRDKLYLQFDADFFKGHSNAIKLSVNTGEKKADGKPIKKTLSFAKTTDIPEDLRYKYYLSVLTRANSRFSKESQVYVSLFLEHVMKQVVTNALHNAVRAEKKSIEVEHIRLSDDAEFLQKYVSLPEFIKNTNTYQRLSELEASVKVKKSRGKKAAEEEDQAATPVAASKPAAAEDAEPTLMDKLAKVFKVSDYITKQIGGLVRVTLARDFGEDAESPYFKVNFSSAFKTFCFNLMSEIVYKIGSVLQLSINSFGAKTINHNTVFTTISGLLVSLNTDTADVIATVQHLETVYGDYLVARASGKKDGDSSHDDDEDQEDL